MRATPFELVKNRIDLAVIPFTDRRSRLLLFRAADGGLWLGLAEYETLPSRAPVLTEWHFTNETGSPLACHITTYADRLECETEKGVFTITFVDTETLLVALPSSHSGMTFDVAATAVSLDTQGGSLQLGGERQQHITYTTSASLVHNEVKPDNAGNRRVTLAFKARPGQALILNVSNQPGKQSVPDSNKALAAAERRWHAWFAAAPEVAAELQPQYYFAWWVMYINLIRPRFCPHYEAVAPSKLGYLGIWHWDAYFHALALRHVDVELAKDQLRIMLEHQLPNGMIPDVVHDEGVLAYSDDMVTADLEKSLQYVGGDSQEGARMKRAPVTKPPLTAWAAWKVYEVDHDTAFLSEIYDAIVRSQEWWIKENDLDQNGLCEYQHPYSSGLDDSPLWDEGQPVESPDLNSYLCMQYDHLAKMAHALGRLDAARSWHDAAGELAQRMLRLRWDEEAGLFWATKDGKRINARTPFNLYPLITGRMPTRVSDKLVATLADEGQFWSHYPVPTVALDDPSHDPERMWRGPVWLNPNYLLIDGLFRAGYPKLARELRQRTLKLITTTVNDMNEFYHPQTGAKPTRATVAFGWTAALFIDLAISESQERQQPNDITT